MIQERDLTKGAIVKSLWLFALPLMFGNVLQQFYNLVDTWVVGRYLGKSLFLSYRMPSKKRHLLPDTDQ